MTAATQRRRELGSLALSIGIHAGVLAAGSLAWVAARQPSPPEPIEIALVRLNAPAAARQGLPAPSAAADSEEGRLAPVLHTRGPQAAEPIHGSRRHQLSPRHQSRQAGPTVTASFRVAEAGDDPDEPPRPAAPALIAHWQPAADLALRKRSEDRREPRRRPHAIGRADPREQTFAMAGLPGYRPSDLLEPPEREADARAAVDPDSLPFHFHDHGSGALGRPTPALAPADELGGDRRALIETIQDRIDQIAPLVHRTSPGCRNASGLARIRFLINEAGYPIGYQLLSSAGNVCLDAQIDTVLHLAEPYPYVAGWVPVKVRFTL